MTGLQSGWDTTGMFRWGPGLEFKIGCQGKEMDCLLWLLAFFTAPLVNAASPEQPVKLQVGGKRAAVNKCHLTPVTGPSCLLC